MKIIRRVLRIILILFLLLNIISAFHAYKFTHFYPDAEVRDIKPEKMNLWDKARALLFGITYAKSKNLSKPDTIFNTINLTTASGLKIEAWLIQRSAAKGTVILFHGHGASKSKILNEAGYIGSIGFNVLLVDFRAHGGSEGNVCTIGYRETEEVKLAFDYVHRTGEKNISLWGISMGAAAITRAISEYKLPVQRVILEMPFGSLHEAVKARVRIMGIPQQPVSSLLTFWGGAEQGFWAFNHNPEDYVKDINCPVLVQWGMHDARVTSKETEAILKNIKAKEKKLVIYENSKHESLCDKEPAKWRKEVKEFLLTE